MALAYSLDLRERVVASVAGGQRWLRLQGGGFFNGSWGSSLSSGPHGRSVFGWIGRKMSARERAVQIGRAAIAEPRPITLAFPSSRPPADAIPLWLPRGILSASEPVRELNESRGIAYGFQGKAAGNWPRTKNA
jgi:hypothetical protein